MTRILKFKGPEPTVIPSPSAEKILDIMSKQLDVLKVMGQGMVLIDAGTQIEDVTPKGKKDDDQSTPR